VVGATVVVTGAAVVVDVAVVVGATVVVAGAAAVVVGAAVVVVGANVVVVGAAVVVVVWEAAATWAAEPMSGAGGALSRIRNHHAPTANSAKAATIRFLRIMGTPPRCKAGPSNRTRGYIPVQPDRERSGPCP